MSYITYEVIVEDSGTKKWYLNDKLHREDGPAVEWVEGDKFWYLNGKRHREDGPAIEYSNGDKFWFLNDEIYREEEFNRKMSPAIEMTVAEVEEALGKKVKIIK